MAQDQLEVARVSDRMHEGIETNRGPPSDKPCLLMRVVVAEVLVPILVDEDVVRLRVLAEEVEASGNFFEVCFSEATFSD